VTREQLERAGSARVAIERHKRGSILREFPSQFLDAGLAEIERAIRQGDPAARKALKLLLDRRFDK
jgi:hypothetical protein